MTGDEARTKLRATLEGGGVIIGAGAGTGLSAKCAEAGGTDLIIIYNSGRYRMAGRGSLAGLMPYGDANAIVVEMASEVLPVVKETPVLAGVCGTDPFRLQPVFLRQLKEIFAALREGREPPVPGEEARKAVEIVLGAYRSAASGEHVTFPLKSEANGARQPRVTRTVEK